MIRQVAYGVARFTEAPVGTLAAMRAATPGIRIGLMALVACTLSMVVIDLVYGPIAFPHTLLPGGKRAIPPFSIALVELVRSFGVVATLWLGLRLFLDERVSLAEAVWLSVPYALALVGFELWQAGSWFLGVATGLSLYGQLFLIGFGATLLVLTVSVRALAPQRDWLACLPVALGAFFLGTFYPYVGLIAAAGFLVLDRIRALR